MNRSEESIEWQLRRFEELDPHALYAMLRLRQEVFGIEQDCLYQDVDGEDPEAYHLSATRAGRLIGYSRIFGPGTHAEQAAIGRILTAAEVRGTGLGKEVVRRSIEAVYQLFGEQPIAIAAQCYLRDFYESFGFRVSGETYLLDGIDHVDMLLEPR